MNPSMAKAVAEYIQHARSSSDADMVKHAKALSEAFGVNLIDRKRSSEGRPKCA